MIKAVLDTNVIVSALIVKNGKSARIIDSARRDKFELLLSEEIVEEARDAFHRKHIQKRFHLSDEAIEELLNQLREIATFISGQPVVQIIKNDPPDNLVLACAVGGQADYLVSGNKHFLDLEAYAGIKMISPAEFLVVLTAVSSM